MLRKPHNKGIAEGISVTEFTQVLQSRDVVPLKSFNELLVINLTIIQFSRLLTRLENMGSNQSSQIK